MAKASAGGGANYALAVVAVLVMVGFLAWLAMSSEPSTPVMIQEDSMPEAGPAATGTVVAPADFESSIAQYMGQDIQLSGVLVTSKMTPQLLWIELPSGAAFPVKTDSATSSPIPANARVTVVGRVLAKTDSVLDAWQQAGAIRNAGHRAQAEFGTSFIEARAIRSGNQ